MSDIERNGRGSRGNSVLLGLGIALFGLVGRAHAADVAPPIQRPRALIEPSAPTTVASEPVASEPGPSSTPAPDSNGVEPPAPTGVEPPQPTPTTAPAASTTSVPPPRSRPPAGATAPAPRVSAAQGEPGLRARVRRSPKQFRHHGFVVDGRLGTLGCFRSLCGSDSHDARPGVRLDAFVGGNIRGWVDIGLSGGWGTLTPNVPQGTNALVLYGMDPVQLQQALDLLGGQALGIDLASLAVTDSKMRAAQLGPLFRVHFIPRGRFTAYVGTGAQYNLFRTRYATPGGEVRLDFHGIAVPVQGGFGVHVLENLAVGVQFDYLWTWYGLASIDHPQRALTLPVRVLESAAQMQQVDFRRQLPQFWTFTFALRARV